MIGLRKRVADPDLKAIKALPWIASAKKVNGWYVLATKKGVLKRVVRSSYKYVAGKHTNTMMIEHYAKTLNNPYTVNMPVYKIAFKRDTQRVHHNPNTLHSWKFKIARKTMIKRYPDSLGWCQIIPSGGYVATRKASTEWVAPCYQGEWCYDFRKAITPIDFANVVSLFLQCAMHTGDINDKHSGFWAWCNSIDNPKAN